MGKKEKRAARLKTLELDNARLVLIVRGANITRERQAKRIAQLQQQNRAMRKGIRGLWFRVKAWRRARRKR